MWNKKKIGEILKDNLQKKYFIFIYFLTVWIFKINFKIFIFSYKKFFLFTLFYINQTNPERKLSNYFSLLAWSIVSISKLTLKIKQTGKRFWFWAEDIYTLAIQTNIKILKVGTQHRLPSLFRKPQLELLSGLGPWAGSTRGLAQPRPSHCQSWA